LKDMERNAPVLLGQKRDLGRVLESHAQLTARLDIVGAENVALREQYERAMESAHSLKEDVTALSQHNSDLSAQIQHLLARSMEGQGQGHSSGSNASGRPSVALIGNLFILLCFACCQLTDMRSLAVYPELL
jgi:phage shock protein A